MRETDTVRAAPAGRGRRAADRLYCAALTFNLCLGAGYVALWLMLAAQGEFWRADFSGNYAAWLIVAEGQGAHLYDFAVQAAYQHRILDGRSFADGLLPFNYPPHVALLFVGLAAFPRTTAFALWTIGQLALLAALLGWLWRFARAWTPRERLLLLSSVVAVPPLLWTFQQGTFSLLILCCLVQFYGNLKQGRDARAGLWLAGAMIKPQLTVFPALLLLVAGRWRALLSAGLAGAVLVGASVVALGPWVWQDYVGWVRQMPTLFGPFGIHPTDMLNVRGLLAALLGSQRLAAINTLALLVLLAALLGTALLWRGPLRPEAPDFDARFALTIVVGLVASPYLYAHDTVLLILPAVLFYGYLRERDLPRRAYVAFLLANPLVFLGSELLLREVVPVRLPLFMMLVLAGWIARTLWGERGRLVVARGATA